MKGDDKLYLMLSKSADHTKQIILGGKTVIMGTISCLLYLILKRKIADMRIKSKKVLK